MAAPHPDAVYSLADLNSWKFDGVALAVIGHPISHSISPAMHNAALACMVGVEEQFSRWRYFRFDIPPDDLGVALNRFHEKRFKGLNLTVPHKVKAVPLVSVADAVASRMGAVNTLRWREDGYEGFNSDGYGLEEGLRRELNVALSSSSVVLLGAGGAARAAAVQCLESGVGRLWIGNRSRDRLTEVMRALSSHTRFGVVEGFDLMDPPDTIRRADVVINATSIGLREGDPAPIAPRRFDRGVKVFDMIYNPPVTGLLKEARKLGFDSANGLAMLVWQGVRSLEIWSHAKVPAEEMYAAARGALGSPSVERLES